MNKIRLSADELKRIQSLSEEEQNVLLRRNGIDPALSKAIALVIGAERKAMDTKLAALTARIEELEAKYETDR